MNRGHAELALARLSSGGLGNGASKSTQPAVAKWVAVGGGRAGPLGVKRRVFWQGHLLAPQGQRSAFRASRRQKQGLTSLASRRRGEGAERAGAILAAAAPAREQKEGRAGRERLLEYGQHGLRAGEEGASEEIGWEIGKASGSLGGTRGAEGRRARGEGRRVGPGDCWAGCR